MQNFVRCSIFRRRQTTRSIIVYIQMLVSWFVVSVPAPHMYLSSRLILHCAHCDYNDKFSIHLWISGMLNKRTNELRIILFCSLK